MGCGKPCPYSCNRIVSAAGKGPLPAGRTQSRAPALDMACHRRILESAGGTQGVSYASSCQYLVNLANLQRQLSTRADSLATISFAAALCNRTRERRERPTVQQDEALCRRSGPLIAPVSPFQNCRASRRDQILRPVLDTCTACSATQLCLWHGTPSAAGNETSFVACVYLAVGNPTRGLVQ